MKLARLLLLQGQRNMELHRAWLGYSPTVNFACLLLHVLIKPLQVRVKDYLQWRTESKPRAKMTQQRFNNVVVLNSLNRHKTRTDAVWCYLRTGLDINYVLNQCTFLCRKLTEW